jgi:hypothetical protein
MNREELFDLCMYLAASAAGLKDEPKAYGPLRLLEALARLSRLVAEEYGDHLLGDVLASIESKKALQREAPEEFNRFLDDLVVGMLRKRVELTSLLEEDPTNDEPNGRPSV